MTSRNDSCSCGSGIKYKRCCLGKRPLTSKDLLDSLKEQITFLDTSCNSFDQGNLIESKRIALTLRILFHDTKNSKSLLSIIDSNLMMLNTAIPIVETGVKMFSSPLTMQKISKNPESLTFKFEPALENFKESRPWNFIEFKNWWNQVILVDSDTITYTREELVLHMADTDGGAHVDPKQDEKYYELSKTNKTGIRTYKGDITKPETLVFSDIDSKPHLPAMRQIGFEVLHSIRRKYSEI